MITFTELERHESEILFCNYIVGVVGDKYIYVWSQYSVEVEIEECMITNPECMHGAMIGTKEEIIWELENCVGSFRECGDEAMEEESTEIVDELVAAVEQHRVAA